VTTVLYRPGRLLLIAVLIASTFGRAGADSGPLDVSLQVARCVPVDARKVRRVFAIELRTSIAGASLGARRGSSRIEVSCQGPLTVIRVNDPVTGKTLSRRVDLSASSQSGRERLVALAAVELLVASWVELETTGRRVPSVDERAPEAVRRSAKRVASKHLQRSEWSDSVFALGVVAAEDHGLAGGGGVRWVRDHGRRRGFSVSALFDTAAVSVDLGTVRVRSARLAAAVHVHGRWRPLRWRLGGGGEVGVVTMSGRPSDPSTTDAYTVVGMSLGPLVRADAELPVKRLIAALSFESGYHSLGVGGLVDRMRQVGVRGPWMMIQLGVGMRW
jgi:hypothetical protein